MPVTVSDLQNWLIRVEASVKEERRETKMEGGEENVQWRKRGGEGLIKATGAQRQGRRRGGSNG